MYSFRTNGNFIDFVNIDSTSLAVKNTIMSLHNTSKCIDWSLPEDTDRISFVIDEVHYKNVLIADIDFNGTAMDSQDDFETNIVAMFPGLGGSSSSSSYLVAEVELTDAQIKALPTTQITLVPAAGVGKAIIPLNIVCHLKNYVADYTNIAATAQIYFASNDYILSLRFREDSGAGVTNLIAAGANNIAFSPSIFRVITSNPVPFDFIDPTAIDDWSLYIKALNPVLGNFTGGDAGTILKVTVYYVVVDL